MDVRSKSEGDQKIWKEIRGRSEVRTHLKKAFKPEISRHLAFLNRGEPRQPLLAEYKIAQIEQAHGSCMYLYTLLWKEL